MPVNSDIRQSVILALQTEGVDALGIVRDAMREVQGEIAVLNREFDGTHPGEYLRSLQSLGKTLDWLAGQEKELTQALNAGVRERIAAVDREARARMEAAERAAEIDGEALRRRIDAAARAERAAEAAAAAELEAIERVRVAEIEALGQRAQARARAERQQEQAAASAIQAAGDEKRARIDAAAAAEQVEERANRRQEELVGDLMRRRIDAHAADEARGRAAAEAHKATVDQQIADEARLQAALGGMEKRQHDLAAEEAYEQQLQDEARLQERLAQMERETAEAAVEGQHATVAARQRGEQAIIDQIEAIERAKVADIEAMGQRAQAYARAERQREAADAAANQRVGDLKRASIDALARAERQTDAWRESMEKLAATARGGFASAADEAAAHTRRMGQMAMGASYLFQDMQYGVAAVANNIGMFSIQLGQAFPKLEQFTAGLGGTAGLGAAVMGVTVAGQLLYDNWSTIVSALSGGLPEKPRKDAQELKEELEKFQSIRIKTQIDYVDISNARKELAKLTEEEATYNQLKGKKTAEQQKRGEVITQAIVEGGGATDYESSAENITRVIADKFKQESPEVKGLKDYISERRRRIASPEVDETIKKMAAREIEGATAKLNVISEEQERMARSIVARAAAGYELEAQQLAEFFRANESRFADRGVDTLRFGTGLEMAGKENLYQQEREKLRLEQEKKAKEAEAKRVADEIAFKAGSESTFAGEVGKGVTAAGPGFDEDLEKRMFDAIKGGTAPGEAMAGAKADLVAKLAGRVPEAVVGAVADAILKKAADAAQNLILESKKPRIDVKAGVETKKAETAKEKGVNDLVTRFKPGFDDALSRSMLEGIGNRETPERATARLLPQLQGKLRAGGVAPDLAGPVAAEIIRKVMDDVRNKLQEAAVTSGSPPTAIPAIARSMAADAAARQGAANRKVGDAGEAEAYGQMFQGLTGANEGQSRQAGQQVAGLVEKGASVEQAMQQVFNRMVGALQQVNRSQLQQLAMMEAANGIIGQYTLMLNQLDARTRSLGANLRTLNNQNRKNAQNKGPLLPAMNPGAF